MSERTGCVKFCLYLNVTGHCVVARDSPGPGQIPVLLYWPRPTVAEQSSCAED